MASALNSVFDTMMMDLKNFDKPPVMEIVFSALIGFILPRFVNLANCNQNVDAKLIFDQFLDKINKIRDYIDEYTDRSVIKKEEKPLIELH